MYEQLTLPNGVRILTEQVPGVRSAALGFWIGAGSRHETAAQCGAAHFIEHMAFKGTETRSAAQIAETADAIGGQLNAYTTKESTCYYIRTLDTHLEEGADLLWDMVFHSRFDQADVELERGVILEEIGMYEDTPEDLCAERLFSAVYKGTALARPILGRPATLERLDSDALRRWHAAHYRPSELVVSLAGSFSPHVVEGLAARFSSLCDAPSKPLKPACYRPAITTRRKAIEQNHLTLAFPGLPLGDDRRFALQLLSSVLGGGSSSRLFQQVRERQGLCYSIYSYNSGHTETGLFAIYTALGSATEGQALDTILAVVKDFLSKGFLPGELDRAREQSKANVLMGLESTQARMGHLGRSALLSRHVLTPDAIIAAYDAVTEDGVRTLAAELLDFSRASLSAVGRVGSAEHYQALLR